MPIPNPPQGPDSPQLSGDEDNTKSSSSLCISEPSDSEWASKEPHLITQEEVNDLIRDLSLTKGNAKVLGSRLKEWNLLADDARTSVYRKCHQNLSRFYHMSKDRKSVV